MIKLIAYFLISIAATSAGAMTGMGGGVIIKPVLDLLKDYDVATIGVLSSITVFAMAIVSVAKQIQQKVVINYFMAIPLALGSVAGGIAGEKMLTAIIKHFKIDRIVLVVQNIILAILIIIVFFYMINKSKISSLGIKNIFLVIIVGIFLGIVSSFLGIGGGPINVAILIFMFSLDTKTATVCSIITILFAQISKLSSIAFGTGFSKFNLSMLLPMVIGAILGGFIGSRFNKKLPERTVEYCFNGVQIIVLIICLYNIGTNIM